jgi:hypothetical protein
MLVRPDDPEALAEHLRESWGREGEHIPAEWDVPVYGEG